MSNETATANLLLVDGQLFAEYENEDGTIATEIEVAIGDFNDFAEVKTNRWDIVIEDKEDTGLYHLYDEWFSGADNLREEYAKSLPAYRLFLQMVEAMAEHKKANKLV